MFEPLEVPYRVRDRHIFVPGLTGHGKSTLFHSMIYQDIKNGAGVCVIDPKGDLVKQLRHWIPKERVEDTVYLDLNTPVPIDFMSYDTADQDAKGALVGDLKYILMRGVNVEHAPRMNAILDDVIYTLLDANEDPKIPSDRKATFIDIYDFLEDEERHREILRFVNTKRLKRRWEAHVPSPKEREPIISRMTPFVNNSALSIILGTPNPRLNVADFMNNRKILLVDLGGVSESKMLYGSLLVSRIQQAAFARHSIRKNERVPFFLYVDEFENFQNSTFHKIISQARGYKLCLTVGCQWLEQLNSDVKPALFTVSSYIIFAVTENDSRQFRALIRPYEPDDLVTLPPHKALYLIDKKKPIIKDTPPPPPHTSEVGKVSYAEEIKQKTIENYGVSFAERSTKRSTSTADVQVNGSVASSDDDDRIDPIAGDVKDIPPHGREDTGSL